jgi:hypothetical protein
MITTPADDKNHKFAVSANPSRVISSGESDISSALNLTTTAFWACHPRTIVSNHSWSASFEKSSLYLSDEMKYNEAGNKSQFGGVIVMKDNKETEEVEEGKEQNKREGNYMAEGMCLGMVIGMVIGSVTNNIPIGMTLGMCVGLAVGTSIKKK